MVNGACRTVVIFSFVVCSVCSYGCSIKEPVLSQVVQVEVLTDHVVDIKSYKLPKGHFRGVSWASLINNRETFEIWIISGNMFTGREELFYYIQSPPEFVDEATDTTDAWAINESVLPKNKMTYLVKRKDGSKSIRLTMPLRKQHYSFAISENGRGDEIVLFMDVSEYVVGNGIFGYVLIHKDRNNEL